VVHAFQLQLATLFYDTSTFFTSRASGHERSPRAPRGHSKQKRLELRLCSLAWLVTRAGQRPLSADLYAGQTVEATRFPIGRKPESEFCFRNMDTFRFFIQKMESDKFVRQLFTKWANH
jgi:hypothetical protein